MLSRHFVSAFIILLCLSCHALASVQLSFTQDNNVRLNCAWDFYPEQLLLPSQMEKIQPQMVELPQSFTSITGQKDTFGTFSQQFKLPTQALGQYVYLYVPYQYGAYKLYLDDNLLMSVGHVGTHADTHETVMAPKLASFMAQSSDIRITIQASSFQHMNSGLENEIWIGYSRPLLDRFYSQIIPLSVVSGILLMIGIFMVFFTMFRRFRTHSNHVFVFLGLFILCLSLRSFFAVPFIYTLFTEISWLWGTRFEYLLTQLACLFFLAYIYYLPYQLIHRYLFKLTIAIILLNVGLTLFSQPIVFQNFFFQSFSIAAVIFINLLYSVYRLHHQGIQYSRLNSIAIIVVCLTFIHDYLLGLKLIHSVEIAFYSSCAYFMLITFQLSRDYAIQSEQAMRYNKKLIELNENLDAQVNDRTQHIHSLNEQLTLQLRSDTLTGAYNRYALNEEIQRRFELAKQQQQSLAFLMIDVDYFKNYNDAYGHLRGDDVLRQLVHLITEKVSDTDFLARYGGEEFAIISNLNTQDVILLIGACLQHIREANIAHAYRLDEKKLVTVSIGAAVMDDKHPYDDITELMKAADHQLYKAKIQRDCAKLI